MKKVYAIAVTGGVTQTSKMPCKSYSLPAIACKTGAQLAKTEGTICSDCYAMKGFYKLYEKTVEPAQVARLSSLDDPEWIDAMVTLIGVDPYFRWHDSGDLQSLEHLLKICAVARRTPKTRHWLPTREFGIVNEFIYGHTIPENLTIRMSATFPNKPIRVPVLWRSFTSSDRIAVSNVHTPGKWRMTLGRECPAPQQEGKCGECRACWNPAVTAVSYAAH